MNDDTIPADAAPALSRAERRQKLNALRTKRLHEAQAARKWKTRLKRAFNAYMNAVEKTEQYDRQIAALEQ